MQNVNARNVAVRVDELGLETGDVAGLARQKVRRVEPDDVLARPHRDGPIAVVQVLDARVVHVRDRAGLVLNRRRARGGAGLLRAVQQAREQAQKTDGPPPDAGERQRAAARVGRGTWDEQPLPPARPCATGHGSHPTSPIRGLDPHELRTDPGYLVSARRHAFGRESVRVAPSPLDRTASVLTAARPFRVGVPGGEEAFVHQPQQQRRRREDTLQRTQAAPEAPVAKSDHLVGGAVRRPGRRRIRRGGDPGRASCP